ncbi:MAG: hypothetical protein ABSD78_14765 [Acidimicrobiales bacterium]|jgi:hypothetical protein
MIRVSIYTNDIRPDGQLVDRLAATFVVWGQDLKFIEGSEDIVQVGIPVFSERYGRLIDFDTDGEEWARNLPSAYRNGAVSVAAEEVEVSSSPWAKAGTKDVRAHAQARLHP